MNILHEQIWIFFSAIVLLIGYLIGVHSTDKELHRLARGNKRGTVKLSKYTKEWLVLYDKQRNSRTFIVSIIANILVWTLFVVQIVLSMIATTEARLVYAYIFFFASLIIYAAYIFVVLIVYSIPRKQ